MATKIMIDPGHAGLYYNASPLVEGYYESAMAWKLSHKLKEALETWGFEVGLTRQSLYEDPELTARGRMAKGYDLFLSLHSNAASFEEADYPLMIHMASDDKTDIDEISCEIAHVLGDAVAQAMGCNESIYYTKTTDFDRDGNGYLDDEYYGVLFGAKSVGVPGVIVEHSFHTNERAARWLLSDENLTALAEAEAAAIAELYDLEGQKVTKEEQKKFEALEDKVKRLGEIVDKYEKQKVYKNAAIRWAYIDGNLPEYATPTIKKLVHKGYLNGGGDNSLELSEVMMRILVILDRAKVFD